MVIAMEAPTGAGARRSLVAVAATGAVALTWLADQATVLVRQCMAADGLVEWIGVHLAVLRTGADCPDGTLALGGGSAQVLTALLGTVLVLAALHAVGGVVGLGLAARAGGVLRAALDAVRARRGPRPVLARVPGRARLVVVGRAPAALTRPVRGGVLRRGPPALHPA